MKTRELSIIGLLSIVLSISGAFKLPGIIPGTEFQLSAPIAIGISVCFGFKRYFLAGLISSIISLLLGTHTIINVAISIIFRIVAGGLIHMLGTSAIVVILAGPIGTIIARIVLGILIGKGVVPLIIAAMPGMLYTSVFSWPVSKLILKVKALTSWRNIENGEKTF